mmetsp:Transcript_2119/g.3745  ORF Transcript_2119/g.3745 Transcript_2119/m.3745 type:complete len:429 (+) Transcript_2119:138-1424(+)
MCGDFLVIGFVDSRFTHAVGNIIMHNYTELFTSMYESTMPTAKSISLKLRDGNYALAQQLLQRLLCCPSFTGKRIVAICQELDIEVSADYVSQFSHWLQASSSLKQFGSFVQKELSSKDEKFTYISNVPNESGASCSSVKVRVAAVPLLACAPIPVAEPGFCCLMVRGHGKKAYFRSNKVGPAPPLDLPVSPRHLHSGTCTCRDAPADGQGSRNASHTQQGQKFDSSLEVRPRRSYKYLEVSKSLQLNGIAPDQLVSKVCSQMRQIFVYRGSMKSTIASMQHMHIRFRLNHTFDHSNDIDECTCNMHFASRSEVQAQVPAVLLMPAVHGRVAYWDDDNEVRSATTVQDKDKLVHQVNNDAEINGNSRVIYYKSIVWNNINLLYSSFSNDNADMENVSVSTELIDYMLWISSCFNYSLIDVYQQFDEPM